MNEPLTEREIDAALAEDNTTRGALLVLSLRPDAVQHVLRAAFLAGAQWALRGMRATTEQETTTRIQ